MKNQVTVTEKTKLTNLEISFTEQYVLLMDGKKAVLAAGFPAKGAADRAEELLAKANVRFRINHLLEEKRRRYAVTEQRIIQELAQMAFFDPLEVYELDGSVKPLNQITPEARRCIKDISFRAIGKGRNAEVYTQYSVHDKMRGLELLGKYLALFTDKVDISGKLDVKRLSDGELSQLIDQLIPEASAGVVIDGEAAPHEGT